MALIPVSELLQDAQQKGYAVPAFNVENMEMMQAVVEAGRNVKSPVLLQTSPTTLKYASAAMFHAMATVLSNDAGVPVALHLDHGNNAEICQMVLATGYSGLMIDGSTLPYEENVELARRVVEIAQKQGIPVEAELGAVGGKEDNHEVKDKDAFYTNPAQAADFVHRTGIQSLAVAIGTAHGHYKGIPQLDFDRLANIRKEVTVPLVLHGTSGVPDEDVVKCIGLGICKVNYATDLRDAYTGGVRGVLLDQKVFDPKAFGKIARQCVCELCEKRMQMCGSAQKV